MSIESDNFKWEVENDNKLFSLNLESSTNKEEANSHEE